MREWHVYIMASQSRVLYVGVTGDLLQRVLQHKEMREEGFTRKYRVTRLVYYEAFPSPVEAIAAEKRLKGWLRAKKVALIESVNPEWRDLSEGWYDTDAGCSGE